MATPTLTVRDLIEHANLGLTLASQAEVDRPVIAAHAIEIARPSRWLKPGSIMLTTGLRMVGLTPGAAGEAELIDELVEAGVSALCFGVGVHFDTVPRPLVLAASERDLPVLVVPPEVPFFEIEDVVNRVVHQADAYLLQRQLWLQNDLLGALAEPEPVRALVHRLATVIRGTAVIYEEGGRQVASVGEGPTRLISTELQAKRSARQMFSVGRWHVLARPIVVRGVGFWLALASRRESTLIDVGDALLESAQRILAAATGIRALGATQLQAEAAELMRRLGQGLTTEEAERVWERLRSQRFARGHPVRVFTALPYAMDPGSIDALLATLHDEAQLTGLALTLHAATGGSEGVDPSELTGLVGEGRALDAWLDALTATHHVGLSEPFEDFVSAPRQIRDARRAAQVAVRRGTFGSGDGLPPSGMVVRFEDVDLATWLLSSRGQAVTAAKVHQQLSDLLDRPDLVETVITWLSQGMDTTAAADALFVHPNTVRYRLTRVEQILEAPITSPTIIANLYLAFHDRLAPS